MINVKIPKAKQGIINIYSWYLYDFASSAFLFSAFLYFENWSLIDMHLNPFFYALSIAIAMALSGLFSPLVGKLIEYHRSSENILAVLILISTVSYFLIGGMLYLNLFNAPNMGVCLILYSCAILSYNLSLVPYNFLISKLPQENNRNILSGKGIAAGNLGQIVSGIMLIFVVNYFGNSGSSSFKNSVTFMPTALFYFIFSLPIILLFKIPNDIPISHSQNDVNQNSDTRRISYQLNGGIVKILFSVFFLIYAVSSLGIFSPFYVDKILLISGTMKTIYFIVGLLFAFMGGMSFGKLVGKSNPLKIHRFICASWLLFFIFMLLIRNPIIVWVLPPIFGILLSMTWANLRMLILQLYPDDKAPLGFGIYNLIMSIATILGPLLWSVAFNLKSGLDQDKILVAMIIPGAGYFLTNVILLSVKRLNIAVK